MNTFGFGLIIVFQLRQGDEQINALLIDNQELKKRLAKLENKAPRTEQAYQRRKHPQLIDEHERNEVKDLAQHFTYTNLLWIHNPSLTFNSVFDDDWQMKHRFADEEGIVQGQYRQLLDFLPDKWHEHMGDDLFINTVSCHSFLLINLT